MEEWSPSLPSGIPRDTPLDAEPSASGLPWESSPPSSHIAGWRFYDARKYSFLRKFGDEFVRGKSQLQVRFRVVKTGRLKSEYWYFFSDHDEGQRFLAEFRAAAQPGHVVDAMEAAGVPYRKQGQFS